MPDHRKAYLRDGVPGLTMAQQEAVLTAAGVNLAEAYRDPLTKAACKRRSAADLKERALMLRPTSRQEHEVIAVAGLRVLGWTIEDICDALAAAGRRNAHIQAINIDRVFTVDSTNADLIQAIGDASRARKREQTAEARKQGVSAAKAKRNKRRDAAKADALPMWISDMSQDEIAAKVGVTVRTLNNWLGPRTEARRKAAETAEKRGKHL